MSIYGFQPAKIWSVLERARKDMNNIGSPSKPHPHRFVGEVFIAEPFHGIEAPGRGMWDVCIEGDGTSVGDTVCVGRFYTEDQARLFAGLLACGESEDK